jgi:hypothetical protein
MSLEARDIYKSRWDAAGQHKAKKIQETRKGAEVKARRILPIKH